MAGYSGYSKSNNAVTAEREGRFPISRAAPKVAKAASVTRKKAREALLAVGACESHHTSKFYNLTDYYEVDAAVRYLKAQPALARLPEGWLDTVDDIIGQYQHLPLDERRDRIDEDVGRFASKYGVDPESIHTAYYGAWNS